MLWRRVALLSGLVLAACNAQPLRVEILDGSTPGPSLDGGATPPGTQPLVYAGIRLGPPYPIVLLHGMAGFQKLQNVPIGIAYFNGIVEDLALHGEPSVFVTLAPPYDSSEVRAKAIAIQIDAILASTGRAKVNLIGHSQGGLDARLLASPNGLGYGDRIASITTVATPHRGTRLSDAALGLLALTPKGEVDALTEALLGVLQRSIYDVQTDADLRSQVIGLSEDHMKNVFNPKYVDDPRVQYASYAGRTNFQTGLFDCDGNFPNDPTRVDVANPLFAPIAPLLAGPLNRSNDGLVTVESARWGTFMQCVPADHLKEVGVLSASQTQLVSGFDHRAFFRSIVARVRGSGL
jgi:triacylglycerol lipase